MKSFIRSKIIGGFEYKYRITPYYDKGTKKVKQRSKYIGKVIGDKVVKVRQISFFFNDFYRLCYLILNT